MPNSDRILARRRWLWLWPACWLALVLTTSAAVAIVAIRDREQPHVDIGQLLDDVGIRPRIGAQVPMDATLTNERGEAIHLSDLSAGRPTILAMVYYRCPMLCNLTMAGLIRGLKQIELRAGRDFDVAVVSFDPRETPALAAAARQTALARYGRPGTETGWHFLTGSESEVRRLADSVGFGYRFDAHSGQYAHAAGLIVLAPDGVVSRYLYGIDYRPHDLRLALVEGSAGKTASVADRVLLLCYHYDPAQGRYGLAVMNILRLAGAATVAGLGLGIGVLVLREKRNSSANRVHKPSAEPSTPGQAGERIA